MKDFLLQFQEYKNSIPASSTLEEASFLYWLKNYVNKKSNFNIYNFLPGKIYSFEYIDKIEKNKKYINKRPIVFFISFLNDKKSLLEGIDIILIPPVQRIVFFDIIFKTYQNQIEYNLKLLKQKNENHQVPLKINYKILSIILKNISFKNSYRFWDIKKIRDVKEIIYEDWVKLVYLYTRSIEGDNIYNIYNKKF